MQAPYSAISLLWLSLTTFCAASAEHGPELNPCATPAACLMEATAHSAGQNFGTSMSISPLLKILGWTGEPMRSFSTPEACAHHRQTGSVLVDLGLLDCVDLVAAVKNGCVVHGFEPVPRYIATCRQGLPKSAYFDVPLPPAGSPDHMWRQVPELLPAPPSNEGFAFLYNAAVGDAPNVTLMTINSGWSSLITGPKTGGLGSIAPIIKVPVVRLDDVLNLTRPVHLLKLDLQGYELRALQGAQKVLQITRNIGTEFTPYLLDIATPSGADGLLALLHEHHFKCFDYLPPKHMASLPAWERPSDARGWVDALRRHGELGRKGNAKLKMQVEAKRAKKYQLKHFSGTKIWSTIGSCEDIMCIKAG